MNGRPLLALDVDGVVSLFGFDPSQSPAPGRYHLIDGAAHCIPEDLGPRLLRLFEHFEPFWATGWEERANDRLPLLLGIPQLPVITFGGKARFGTAHWKLEPLERHAEGRPLAWVDDSLDAACHAWAARRSAPTLLVPTESAVGLIDAQVEAMIRWANGLTDPGA